jgi:hypothetical protein
MVQQSEVKSDRVQAVTTKRDPARARAARTLAKRRRWAEEMRAAGWTVKEPHDDKG